MLVVRYLSLLFQGADASKILALTFTNKAASEMSVRVVETLEDLENRGELDEIVKVTELSRAEILSKREAVLEEFLNAHTKIMTIDSFFTQILRKFSLYASLMPDFTTFAAQHELKLMSRFLLEVRTANKQKTLINLSLHSKKRLSDIFALLNEFYEKKEELQGLTFSKGDTLSCEHKAMEALGSLAAIVANCRGASATLKNAVIAESFEELLQKSWIVKESLEYWVFKKCFTPEMDDALQVIQESVKEYYRIKEGNFFSGLNELVGLYKKSKEVLFRDESELSFSDVTSLVYEILNLLDDSEFLYFRLDAEIEHMLLDEFQDTSVLQYKILRPLIKEITSGEGIFENGSFFFVGDVKQSIYRFRGGVSALFGEVTRDNNTQVEKLLTNYRSKKEVVEFVNRVFLERIDGYTPQLVRDGANGGYVEVIQNDEITEEVLKQVQRLITQGANLDEIAILCATNADGEVIKQLLQENNIEVVTETTTKLINQQSVRAVIEYLKYLYFQKDIYRYNFFALLHREVEPISFVDFNRVGLLDVVTRAINAYGLFDEEFHLIRFMEVIARYSDIEAFLFEYERIDAAAAASDLRGVRVLTVHKSKGLEYEHVLVIDRLKKPPAARDAIIYEYDGIVLENIYLRTAKRDAIDVEYAKALQKEKALVVEDRLNALYVAFTRARDNLFVITKGEGSEFDILELQPCTYGTLVCEQTKVQAKNKTQKLPYKELYYGTQSEILSVENESEEDLDAIHFGLAMHYMLEMMHDFDKSSLDAAFAMMQNKYGNIVESEVLQEIARRVEMLVENESFLTLVRGEEIYREKALKYKNNLRYIDLLVKKEDGSWVVFDYKSSLSFSKKHQAQVRAYKQAVAEITGDGVSGYLLYLLEDGVKIVQV